MLTGILIEDCHFDFFSNNTVQTGVETGENLSDFIIRRNIISNNYSQTAHAQGIFSANASLFIEENVFDHNGWYKQSTNRGSAKEEGQATVYNHNIYFSQARNMILRRNIFMRPSSINTKFTSNAQNGVNRVRSWNLVFDNNLMLDGDVAMSLGGNEDSDNGARWRSMYVVNNVILDVGKSQPTGRSLGWGLDISDWDTGLVHNNIIKSWGDSTINNLYGLSVSGDTFNVTLTNNTIYDISDSLADDFLVKFNNAPVQRNIIFRNNDLVLPRGGKLVDFPDGMSNISLTGNQYYTSTSSSYFRIGGAVNSLSQWLGLTGESNAAYGLPAYTDPGRTIETYLSTQGQTPSISNFSTLLKRQSKFSWNPVYTARAINDYFRSGFCLSGQSCQAPVSVPRPPTLNPIIITRQ